VDRRPVHDSPVVGAETEVPMSGLAALLAGHTPTDVYQWHSAASVGDVQHAVEKAGWRFAYLDGWTVEDQESFMKSAAACLDASDSGADIDGLASCLDAVDVGQQGMVLLWDGWSPLARKDEAAFQRVLEVLRKRAASGERRLAVVLRGEGPDLDLEELPIKQ
jgi:hypothetical protein